MRFRPSLPASNQTYLPLTLGAPTADFPAVYRYYDRSKTTDSLKKHAQRLNGLLDTELPRTGALLIRGLPITSASEYSALLHAAGMPLRDYVGGVTSRHEVSPKVTPASTEPSVIDMESHNDGTYRPLPPERLLLWCETPPTSGGQALITDARAVLRRLRENAPAALEELERRKVRYTHFLPDRNFVGGGTIGSWQDALALGCEASAGCNASAVAESTLSASGYNFRWSSAGLHKWVVTAPVLRHRISGEESWVNQVRWT